jgi:membrane-bound metal-dependent hydrolase YbcI (DUF457 family)
MTGKSHLAAVASHVVIADTGLKLTADLTQRADLLSVYRNYATSGITDNVTAMGVAGISISAAMLFVGSVLPDIDCEKSMLGRYFHLPVKHRTFTHSILFLIPAAVGAFFWSPLLWLAFGMFSHMFCDSFSKAGVCWFWPLSRYKHYESGAFVKKEHFLKLYETGGVMEYVWVSVGWAIAVLLYFHAYLGLEAVPIE